MTFIECGVTVVCFILVCNILVILLKDVLSKFPESAHTRIAEGAERSMDEAVLSHDGSSAVLHRELI